MNFGQLIEYNKRTVFLQKSWKKMRRRLVPDLSLFLKKVSDEVKARGLLLILLYL